MTNAIITASPAEQARMIAIQDAEIEALLRENASYRKTLLMACELIAAELRKS